MWSWGDLLSLHTPHLRANELVNGHKAEVLRRGEAKEATPAAQ